MEHDWKKATVIHAVAAKTKDAANLTFARRSTPTFNEIGIDFYMI